MKGKGEVIPLVHDVGSAAGWADVAAVCRDRFQGKADILVNNAGIMRAYFLEDLTEEQYDEVVGANAKGVFLGMKTVVPFMKANQRGSIVNFGSIASVRGVPRGVAYAGSKGAVKQMTMAAALELAPHNIRVNALLPGTIHTPMVDDLCQVAHMTADEMSDCPMQRIGRPEEVAQCALFLASDMSSYVTGTHLLVDGGKTAGLGTGGSPFLRKA
ncbi:3alpha(or 20beta)-hydroxysteroid dehydrogenase [Angomonas deanei]|uniref:Short chain dehydrogenase/Enoyl-(Acyl carrier protein) reductase, putative n=1 Tax=Angomonas deanei TaxID=59799 RepID=A0A7G2C541_9TRYP|nr:3alpha(or 20beta)-hydroxysteroid dehydrogenase [Angomonas deanei]CAD2213863.1 short chain dehydrogenase/Enoyl-(Acyl carrier protein) reductase, putative [Angomonas deanei]|eukprot:EPY33553.1 3alpha(or 20beta)-hydroxysteroid dehydrogenase [Angomonas deanei]